MFALVTNISPKQIHSIWMKNVTAKDISKS